MLNDLIDLLADVPPRLAFMWAAWMTVGLALNFWHRRAKRNQLTMDGPTPRPKSGVKGPKAPSGVRPQAASGDAFGELEALLDAPTEPAPSGGYHRRPGEDSPVLSEAAPTVVIPRAPAVS
jgi:hypothetical protein